MQFTTKHCRIRRFEDCWGVSTRAGEGAKKEWNDDRWFYATLQAAAHKALEIETRTGDDVTDLRNAVKEIDAAYDRICKGIDELVARAKEAGVK